MRFHLDSNSRETIKPLHRNSKRRFQTKNDDHYETKTNKLEGKKLWNIIGYKWPEIASEIIIETSSWTDLKS